MNKAEQLEWEARLSRPAAYAAFGAAVLFMASFILLAVVQSGIEDRPGVLSGPDSLLAIADAPGMLIVRAVVEGLAVLLLILVFLYLFRATVARIPSMPGWFVYLIYAGPVLFAIAQVLVALETIDVAETFADGSYSFPGADPQESPNLTECPAVRGELGDACAEELSQQDPNNVAAFTDLIGRVLVAFLFVMLPLRARRAGLVSPFMSILGPLAGAMLVLPLLPPVILQAFWLGALGALFLGTWPGGRGPAWASGEAEPWPSPAQRRGLMGGRGSKPADAEPDVSAEPEPAAHPDAPAEPEPTPQRPKSRKRKRKRH